LAMFDPVFSRLMIAYDGSEPSKHALEIAAKMATMFRGELIILTVVPPETIPVIPGDAYSGVPVQSHYDFLDHVAELYKKALDEAEKQIKGLYPDLKVEAVMTEGRPSKVIADEAENRKVDLIVVGNRGLGGISGWILGSTSRRVVDLCTKPILVVK